MPAQTETGGRAILWVPVLFVALAVGIALGGAGVYYYFPPGEQTTTTDKLAEPSRETTEVVALGRIEPRDGVLSLGVPTPDRIREIKVEEGQMVEQGQPLAILDSEEIRKLEREMATIQLDQAKERLAAIKENGQAQISVEQLRRDRIEQLEPIELKTLRSKINLLKAQHENAQRNYKRYTEAGDIIAGMDKEKQMLVQRQIEAELDATEDQVEKVRQSSKLDRNLASAQLKAATAELKQTESTISLEVLKMQVTQAQERLKDAQIHAPSKGKILRILVHKGELVQAKPILQMANVEHMIVRAEVDESDIQRVRPSQSVIISSHIFPEKTNPLHGKVVSISSSVGKAEVIPLDPRASVDNRVVEVKIELEEPKRAADLIGHQVRVAIQTGGAAEKAR